MIVNQQAISAVFVNLLTIFQNALGLAPTTWEKIAMLVPSTSKTNDYSWIANFPRMRKWISEKVVKALSAAKYLIENDDFEATVEVDRNDIEDDTLGVYSLQAQSASYSTAQLPDEIVYGVVNKGFDNPCYDGKSFFATDHPVGKGVVSNKGTVALSMSTQAAARASYGAARTAMKKIKDDEGRPLNVTPNILLVGPMLEDIARALLMNDRLEDGKSNPYKGSAELVVSAHILSDTAWYLLDTTKPLKPFLYQVRKAPVFVQQTDPQSDGVFMRKKFKFGAEARVAGGYGLWQCAYGSTGEG